MDLNNPSNIKEWAKNQVEEKLKEIKYYINEGIEKEKALEMVLKNSILGSGYKAQIEYEIKYYKP